ncbi:DUF2964 family protein [Paraburkholderia sp. Tr-20389]|uniref:DUF2964 family protein n=1 Tax=Paraburkholderia sp. Tr-20389 TaxID=2703903 RepID=UPI00197E269F|nr:DUF2964 family protein [Paraburkholderia sp. Tr-20389]MBN3756165.1 DUF2964 family protein [Paraburkholderia sp. Tr-20389]
MFQLKLRSILLKVSVFVAVGAPLGAFSGMFSGGEALTRYAAAACVLALASCVLLLKSARNDDI